MTRVLFEAKWKKLAGKNQMPTLSCIAAVSLCFLIGLAGCGGGGEGAVPIASGDYKFSVREAEFGGRIPGGEVTVKIRRSHITVLSGRRASIFPEGLVEEGELMWHANSGQWIIGTSAADAAAPDVGGCSDGPSVIDLQKMIYWTC